MRRRLLPETKDRHVNVTPLIDVVMCVIVFFMLAARIGVDTGIDRTIAIPATILGTNIRSMDLGNSLTLNIRAGPDDQPQVTALLHGELQPLLLLDPETGRNPLVDSLRFFRFGRDLLPGGWGVNEDNPAFNVVIRGERDMTYRCLEPVLLACAEAHVKSVSFATEIVHERR